VTAALPVEQAAQQRGGVEARQAQPADAAVQADQGNRRSVTDQAKILERRVAVPAANRPEGRITFEHESPVRDRLPVIGCTL
jgi:hypothetical protein